MPLRRNRLTATGGVLLAYGTSSLNCSRRTDRILGWVSGSPSKVDHRDQSRIRAQNETNALEFVEAILTKS
jgi:hypothetical protein